MSVVRTKLKGGLHQELFTLQRGDARQKLRYALVDDSLRQIFAKNGHPLGSNTELQAKSSRKWKLRDEKNAYLVKDVGDHLVVIKEKHPRLSSLVEFVAFEGKSKARAWTWRLRSRRLQRDFARKKRQERPSKLCVNIAAGVWHAPGWKVLDYDGDWYRYNASFVDFKHDLTSNEPFALAEGSVDLFYCEHSLEHFTDGCCEHILREAHRCLKVGGGFRIVLPDAHLIYDRLVKRDETFFKSWMDRDNASMAESFRTLVGHARSPLDEADFDRRLSTMPMEDFLNWCKQGLEYDWRRAGEHINWFTFEKLTQMLERAGFREVRRCAAQQSQFPEARGPGFDTRAWYSLHAECLK
jgi:predicted SAM-dependent methyltransferase